MTATPASARSRLGALALCLAALGAACGGGGDSTATTEPAVTEPPATEVATTEPATTEVPTTESATTEPTTVSGFTGEGTWTAYYLVTDNGGWYSSDDVAYGFPVEFECADESCTTGTRTANPAGEPVATEFEFDGDILTTQVDLPEACLNPATGVADGPPLTATTAIDTMAPVLDGPEIVAFVGVRNFAAVTVGSDQCTAENLSYTADVVYARDDTGVPAALTADGWFRAGVGEDTIERAVRVCTATACDLQYRMPKQMLAADGTYQPVFVDVLLTQGDDGVYTGSASWVDSCASDIDGSFVAAEGYDTTVDVAVTFVEMGANTIMLATEAQSGTTHASLTPDLAAVCTPYSVEDAVHGIRMLDTAVEVTSWVEDPINQ